MAVRLGGSMSDFDGHVQVWITNSPITWDCPNGSWGEPGHAQQVLLSVDSDSVNPSINTFELNWYLSFRTSTPPVSMVGWMVVG